MRFSMMAGVGFMRVDILRKLPSATTWSVVGTQMFQNATGTIALKGDIPNPATLTPYMDNSSGYVGDHMAYAREDHVHPSDGSKQNALSAAQLANIAAVSDAAGFSPLTMYAAGQAVVYNNAVYVFTSPHSGAWIGTDVKKVNLLADKANKATPATAGNLASLTSDGGVEDSGVRASDKLDASSASDPFSDDSTVQYPVGSHCTYQGKLYKCTTATTGGTWVAASWEADTMTDPDAVLDITAQNQLRVVAKDGTLLWAQGYDLASTSSATLACDACNNFTFADGATTQAFTLPTAPTGKVGDFGLDVDNSANTGAATMTLTGLDTAFSVVVPEGESLNDMLAIAAGELARFYISLSTFRINNLPTWHIVKQVVENGGAQS